MPATAGFKCGNGSVEKKCKKNVAVAPESYETIWRNTFPRGDAFLRDVWRVLSQLQGRANLRDHPGTIGALEGKSVPQGICGGDTLPSRENVSPPGSFGNWVSRRDKVK